MSCQTSFLIHSSISRNLMKQFIKTGLLVILTIELFVNIVKFLNSIQKLRYAMGTGRQGHSSSRIEGYRCVFIQEERRIISVATAQNLQFSSAQ